ncbi:valine--tRNA ligase, partial [Coemansia helicoidea]
MSSDSSTGAPGGTQPPAPKKDLSQPMASAYEAAAVEADWYAWWVGQGFFEPKEAAEPKGTFVLTAPPPNVTGKLHIGHGLFISIQDAM